MKFDVAFPNYAVRMNRFILAGCALGAVFLFVWRDASFAMGWVLGCLFHVLFMKFLLVKYRQWEKAEKDAAFMGQHLFLFTTARFILEILLCVAVVLTQWVNIMTFLAGLLILPAISVTDRLASLIKE